MWGALIVAATFVGAENCKLCHRSVYLVWKESVHRGATERLAPEERTDTCLRCHATGPTKLPGVQCEACHGAGSDYWPAEIMIDPGKSQAAGLLKPGERECRACHGNGPSGHRTEFTMPTPADWQRAIH